VPDAGSYVSEASFSDPDLAAAILWENYPRLLAVKHRYDPDGLFTTHHGVGTRNGVRTGSAVFERSRAAEKQQPN